MFTKSSAHKKWPYLLTLSVLTLILSFQNCGGGGGGGEGGSAGTNNAEGASISLSTQTLISSNSSNQVNVHKILLRSNGDILIAVTQRSSDAQHAGLYSSTDDGNSFARLSSAQGLLQSSVNDVAEGLNQQIFTTHFASFQTSLRGYSQSTNSDLSSFNSFQNNLNLPSGIDSVAINGNGNIFLGGPSVERSTNGGSSFTTISSSGNVWIGKTSNRLYVNTSSGLDISSNNGDSFSTKTTADGLPSNNVLKVIEDSLGNIYALTFNGLAVSTDGGNTFFNRPLAMRTRGNFDGIKDISINSSQILCAAHRSGFDCSADSGHTWSRVDFEIAAPQASRVFAFSNKILITDTNKIFLVGDGVNSTTLLSTSNSILPSNIGNRLNGVIPTQLKASTLPAGRYVRQKTFFQSASTNSGDSIVLDVIADTSSVSFDNFHGENPGDAMTSSLQTFVEFEKNNDGSVTVRDIATINAEMSFGGNFSGSLSITGNNTTTTAAEIANNEAQALDPNSFSGFHFIDSTTLRRTIRTLDSGSSSTFIVFEDYQFIPN